MILMNDAVESQQAARASTRPPSDDLFDPVIRAIMACDGVGREKTIALVLSVIEQAFPH